jgi:hypothetical protein
VAPEGTTLAVKVNGCVVVMGFAEVERLVVVLVLPGFTTCVTTLEVAEPKFESPLYVADKE